MRDGLFDFEVMQAVEAVKAGQEWSAVRVMHSGVDPVALDRNKATLYKRAGVPLPGEKSTKPAPVPADPVNKVGKKSDPLE